MRANENTGLAEPDIFYFGNAIGEVGDSSADANVLVNDALQVLYNMQTSVPITSRFDVDREGNVLVNDALVCLYNMTSGSQALQLINLGDGGGAGSNFETGDGAASSPGQNMAGFVDRRGLLEAVGLAGFGTESGRGPGGEETHLRLLAVEWLEGGTSRLLFDWRGPLPARVWRATDLEGSGWEPLPQAAVSVVKWPLVTVDVPLKEDQRHAFFRFEVLREQ